MSVKMTSVSWLLANLTDSADGYTDYNDEFDWRSMMEQKSSDSRFTTLIDRILADGFQVPICLVKTKDGWLLGNGHHRMTAAILLCLEEIPVYFNTESRDYMMTDITLVDFRTIGR